MTLLPLAVSGLDFTLYISLAGLAAGIVFGALGMYFHHRRQALWHETARIALEKGQPIPPAPGWDDSGEIRTLSNEQIRANRIRGYLVSGLVNLAIGSGLYLALAQFSQATAYFAAIPGFIGVALLLVGIAELLLSRNSRS